MRISFSTEAAARAAVITIGTYGYEATAAGTTVWTDCPTLLAVSAINKGVGLRRVEDVQLVGSEDVAGQRPDIAVSSASHDHHAQAG